MRLILRLLIAVVVRVGLLLRLRISRGLLRIGLGRGVVLRARNALLGARHPVAAAAADRAAHGRQIDARPTFRWCRAPRADRCAASPKQREQIVKHVGFRAPWPPPGHQLRLKAALHRHHVVIVAQPRAFNRRPRLWLSWMNSAAAGQRRGRISAPGLDQSLDSSPRPNPVCRPRPSRSTASAPSLGSMVRQ